MKKISLMAWLASALILSSGSAQEVNELAPDFTLQQLEGDEVMLSNLRGKVVFINFFGYS
jgi:hypothetical protein